MEINSRSVLSLYALVFIILLAAVLVLNDGIFTYSLDDPYIHLRVGEMIIDGGYGINPGEYSSPSSSIIYPFLLAPFSFFSGYLFVPLIFSFAAGSITIIYISKILETFQFFGTLSKIGKLLVLLGLMIVSNVWGTAFTGMEHYLQVMCTIMTFYILLLAINKTAEQIRWYEYAAIIAGPLLRYENLMISLLVLSILWFMRREKSTIFAALLVVFTVAGFSLFLLSIGLQPLPASIMVKTGLNLKETELPFMLGNFLRGFTSTFGLYLHPVMIAILLLLGIRFRKALRNERLFIFVVSAVILAHFAFGKYGGYGRYEVYLLVTGVFAVTYIIDKSSIVLARKRYFVFTIIFIAALPYLGVTISTPLAAHNIYQQQYQVSRFVKEFAKVPFAANDIGLVSFKSDYYCLDLFGLADHKMAEYRIAGDTGKLQNEIVKKSIQMVMIYPNWFTIVPQEWRHVGTLELTGMVLFLNRNVAIYTSSADYETILKNQLKQFAGTLPSGARIIMQ